jgi:hypothetical protein
MNKRDDFSKDNIKIIAERAAYLCSNPDCRMITSGPHSDKSKSLKNGIACHICAASAGGPRYDPNQTTEERSSILNAIWLCHNCSDVVDKDPKKYTKDVLLRWKHIHDDYIENVRKGNSENSTNKGGHGGEIFIFAKNIIGNGEINVNGGDGIPGRDAGMVYIESQINNFTGKISAKGGNTLNNLPTNKNNEYFENIYSKITGAQLRFLFVLRESMRMGGKGMDCGYVSNYFQNVIGSMTDRYKGWITPFITAYLQEKGLVNVADNYFSLNKIGEEFLEYLEETDYQIKEKDL